MDKEILDRRLKALADKAGSLTFRSFPRSDYGYPSSLSPEWHAWSQRLENLITSHFKRDSAPVQLVERGKNAESSIVGNGRDKFENAKDLLTGALSEARDALAEDFFAELKYVSAEVETTIDPEKIFIVHGHDHASKNETEIFLQEIGLEPVVLHRQADEGKTIIEKFEHYSSVGYAVVLLTPDDELIASRDHKGQVEDVVMRARPNVVFELGYFVGQLGRDRVCCVVQSDVSLYSDISGLIYKQFENSIEEVKYTLVKELRKAGYEANL